MKAVLCLVVVALVASAMAVPVDPILSEAKLAVQSKSDLLTSGNGMYNPVSVVEQKVVKVVVPIREFVVEKGVRDVVLQIV